MAYGTIKVDTITFTDGGIDKSVAISGLVQNPTFTGNVTVTGTVSGNTVQGQTISGVTVTGTTANFTSGNFTNISGGTHTITSGVFAAGTAANPSISFASDPNTGIYSPGADQVAISTNGTGRLLVNHNGYVGVGVTNPDYALDVASSDVTPDRGYALRLRANATVGAASIQFTDNPVTQQLGFITCDTSNNLKFATASTERLRITLDGKLGLGSSSAPGGVDTRMWIDQSSVNDYGLLINSSGGTKIPTLWFRDAAGANKGRIVGQDGLTLATTSGATPALTIDQSQRVGIGTTSLGTFSEKLHVAGIARFQESPSSGAVALIGADATAAYLDTGTYGAVQPIAFKLNGTERARIDSSGRLLVGTSTSASAANPQYARLQIVGNTAGATEFGMLALLRSEAAASITTGEILGGVIFGDSSGNEFGRIFCEADASAGTGDYPGRLVFSTTADGASSPTERLRIDSTGQIKANSLGTAAAPVWSFLDDTNTGIYSPGADQVAISTNGTGRLFVDASGNVGINNASPAAGFGTGVGSLDVNGPLFARGPIAANQTNAGVFQYNANETLIRSYGATAGTGAIVFNVGGGGGSADTEAMRLTAAGRLGLGTSSPDAPLQVTYSSSTTSQFNSGADAFHITNTNTTDNNWAQIFFTDSDGGGAVATFGVKYTDHANDYGELHLATRGSSGLASRLVVDSSGRVGIGTSSPISLCHISGPEGTYGQLRIQATGAGEDAVVAFSTASNGRGIYLDEGDSNKLKIYAGAGKGAAGEVVIDNSGNVGIGTTSPAERLHVAGTTLAYGNGAAPFRWGDTSAVGTLTYSGSDALIQTASASASLVFLRSGVETARIDGSGRLLVGTSSARSNVDGGNAPQVQIEGVGYPGSTMSLTRNSADSGAPIFYFGKTRSASVGGNTAVQSGDTVGQLIWTGSDGTNTIKAAEIKAEVDGTPGANDMPGRLVFSTTADGASSPTERMRITNAGAVLISCTSFPSTTVKGIGIADNGGSGYFIRSATSITTSYSHVDFVNPNGIVGSISTNASATAYNTSSDYRLKEDWQPITGAFSRLQQLKPVNFAWKIDGSRVDGFLAHEAQEVVPECVTGEKDEVDADGNPIYQGIDQSKLVPLLTAALQEALAEIESLKARVTALEP